jgi:hypothetical protein
MLFFRGIEILSSQKNFLEHLSPNEYLDHNNEEMTSGCNLLRIPLEEPGYGKTEVSSRRQVGLSSKMKSNRSRMRKPLFIPS